MEHDSLTRLLQRDPASHKYHFGHVLVIGGAPGMIGAPFMAAMAALRTGAGLVTIASSADVIDKLEARINEIMTLRIPDDKTGVTVLTSFIAQRRVSVVVMGPGADAELAQKLVQLLPNLAIPVVVDAGALNALSMDINLLTGVSKSNQNIIMTPHHGEFMKLASARALSSVDELEHRAESFAQAYGVTLVLKGAHTYVAHPDGTSYINSTGNPGMATAGTGDVLSGIIGGLLGQKLSAAEASTAGVYLHGLAGDLAAAERTQPGLIATDVIDRIPQAYLNVARAA